MLKLLLSTEDNNPNSKTILTSQEVATVYEIAMTFWPSIVVFGRYTLIKVLTALMLLSVCRQLNLNIFFNLPHCIHYCLQYMTQKSDLS